jgi:hypothetical protein
MQTEVGFQKQALAVAEIRSVLTPSTGTMFARRITVG